MKLGIGSYAYAWSIGAPSYPPPRQPLDALGLVQRAAACGVHLVQIADNLPLDALTETGFAELLRMAGALDVGIEVGTRGIQPDHMLRYLEIARLCQSSILRVVVDTAAHHPEPQEVIALLRTVLPAFESAGITIAIENHDRFKVQMLVDIIHALDSRFIGICLDTVNSFGALEDPARVVEALSPYVVNLHIKDFGVRRVSHNMGFVVEGTPAGQGLLDIPRLLEQLSARDFNAILELWPPPEEDVEATAAKEQEWVQTSIAHLRQYILD
ncbi:MAG: sugar phosphate isomerase/epimerase family protein [Chloroflexota bacterium]|nr:sugar phosphate isomerase/epimerase family protein [Chloroflexota bacterium]